MTMRGWLFLTGVDTIEIAEFSVLHKQIWRFFYMNLARWTFLFLSTVGIGMAVSLVIGTGVFLINPEISPTAMGWEGLGYNFINTLIVGALLGAFSHLGFFAYLTVNYFAQGIFRSKLMWSYVQVFLIIVVSVYSALLRIREGESFLPYTMLPLLIFLAAVPVTRLKVTQTNKNSLIPTLFFLTAVTLLEAVPALRQYNAYATVLMVGPLFCCNAWQILRLHKVLAPAGTQEPAHRAS
jgi:KinB signaling pathway activation protein